MNDGLSRLYHVDEQREKKNHVSEIKVQYFKPCREFSWVTVHFKKKVFDSFAGCYHEQLGLGLNYTRTTTLTE